MPIYLILLSFILSPSVNASQDQCYGLGGATTGRTSGVTAEAENAYAALYNPALIAAQGRSLFAFSTTGTSTQLAPLKGVRLQNDRGVAGPVRDDLVVPSQNLALWAAGLTYPFEMPFLKNRAGLGATVSGPFNRLRTFTAGAPTDFQMLRYGTSDAQFKSTVSGSVALIPDTLFFGAGLSLFITSAGAAEGTLVAENPTGRMSLDIGLNTALVSGIYAALGKERLALVYRQEINPALEQRLYGKVQFGGADIAQQPITMRTTLYYEPQIAEFEWQHDFETFKISAGLSYQVWNRYQPSYLRLDTVDAEGKAHGTPTSGVKLHDTWNPRLSVEVPWVGNRFVTSAGYGYRPNPVISVSRTETLLDADTHIVGFSFQHQLRSGELFASPFRWGLFGQYHRMQSGPGYLLSGTTFTYGAMIQAEL